jgi:hypothetical protein
MLPPKCGNPGEASQVYLLVFRCYTFHSAIYVIAKFNFLEGISKYYFLNFEEKRLSVLKGYPDPLSSVPTILLYCKFVSFYNIM